MAIFLRRAARELKASEPDISEWVIYEKDSEGQDLSSF